MDWEGGGPCCESGVRRCIAVRDISVSYHTGKASTNAPASWTAPALWRFGAGYKSGGGPPQSKTLTRHVVPPWRKRAAPNFGLRRASPPTQIDLTKTLPHRFQVAH